MFLPSSVGAWRVRASHEGVNAGVRTPYSLREMLPVMQVFEAKVRKEQPRLQSH
jgi:hypothetical protein